LVQDSLINLHVPVFLFDSLFLAHARPFGPHSRGQLNKNLTQQAEKVIPSMGGAALNVDFS
jgi:hypothetical protein